jgi:MatE
MDAQVRSTDAPISPNGGGVRADVGSRPQDAPTAATAQQFDPRTRLLLEGPIVSTLLRLATPDVLVMFVQASVGLIETYFIAKLGTDALAGVALVFPVLMLMQMMSVGAMGGGSRPRSPARSAPGVAPTPMRWWSMRSPSPSLSAYSSCSPCWRAADGSTVLWAGATRPLPRR